MKLWAYRSQPSKNACSADRPPTLRFPETFITLVGSSAWLRLG
jgi:hypothetical protein